MSALLLEHPLSRAGARGERHAAPQGAQSASARARGGLTLDELITGVWEGLSVRQTVRCPACGGAMTPASESGPRRVVAECGDCGSALS
jgi:hypothetical protein